MSVIDLATVGQYQAQDGDILTGTTGEDARISIAPGAAVTLRSATIAAHPPLQEWPAITCEGDARIILDQVNCIRCSTHRHPGILVPTGATLVLEGPGSLSVSSSRYGAGIGGGYQIPCGNIVIKGGFIVSHGGMGGAGIGSGYYADCGHIRIEGGTITAQGGQMAAGIGSGLNGRCGDISIGPDVIYLSATKGECGDYAADDIGRGAGGSCGLVIV